MATASAEPDITDHFTPLFRRFATPDRRPLLAHYTSIAIAERIISTGEVWFSNPLFMNDWQEMRFGLNEGSQLFLDIELLKKAGGSDERAAILNRAFTHYFQQFDGDGALDVYVFCLSEHDKDDNDGLLSMWRGYGQNGNGVALVFNSASLTMVEISPLLIGQVKYASDKDRLDELTRLLNEWAELTAQLKPPDDQLHVAAFMALHLLVSFALTSKHEGFSEEREW